MKRSFILAFLSVLSLSFVSAAGYSSFGFSGLFSEFNISMYLNALLFITIFAVIFFILKKSPFRENAAVCWIISLCVSAFSIYGILSSGFSFEELLYSLGLNSDMLPTVLAMLGVIIAIFLILKFGFRRFFAIIFALLGTLLIALSIFGVIYEKGAAVVIGIILLLIALILKKKSSGSFRIKLPGIKFHGGARLMIVAEGKRYTSPIFGSIPMNIQTNRGSRIAVENAGDKPLTWLIKTKWGLRASPTRGIVEPGQATEVKIYSDSHGGAKEALVVGKSQGSFIKQRGRLSISTYSGGSSPPSGGSSSTSSSGIRILITEAKAFRSWADKQPNPKMVRSWAYFINWLKNKGYGSNEKDIMSKINVTRDDMIKVVKKYIL